MTALIVRIAGNRPRRGLVGNYQSMVFWLCGKHPRFGNIGGLLLNWTQGEQCTGTIMPAKRKSVLGARAREVSLIGQIRVQCSQVRPMHSLVVIFRRAIRSTLRFFFLLRGIRRTRFIS